MTRTAPPVKISLEHHKHSLEYRKRGSDRVGKTRVAPRKLLFFSMSDESDHSDSEMYYPGELSGADLFQFQLPLAPKAQKEHSSQMKGFSEAVI